MDPEHAQKNFDKYARDADFDSMSQLIIFLFRNKSVHLALKFQAQRDKMEQEGFPENSISI